MQRIGSAFTIFDAFVFGINSRDRKSRDAMDSDGLPIVGTGVDYTKVERLNSSRAFF